MQLIKKRFNVCKKNFDTYEIFELRDDLTGEFASILPFAGGAVNGLTLKSDDRLIEILDGYVSAEDLRINLKKTFKGCSLFPFPNRIADGIYSFQGKKFYLPVNNADENNAIHGLVYDREFEIVGQMSDDNSCSLVLQYQSPAVTEGYPFNYKLQQIYSWKKNKGFECTTKIENISDCEIPIGHGWHPYFKVGNGSINDLALQFPGAQILEVDHRKIPTGGKKQYTQFNRKQQIGDTQLDNCFQLESSDHYATILLSAPQKNFGFEIRQEVGKGKYNFLQIYTPPERRSIAIEPMTCAPDAFNNKMGLITLASGESISLSWSISPHVA